MKKEEFYLQRCGECDSIVQIKKSLTLQHACCPNCGDVLQAGERWSLKRCAIIAMAILILLPFALMLPLMNIDLLGIKIYASVWGGTWKMATAGFQYTAFMILFCAIIMPISFASLVVLIWVQRLIGQRPRYTLLLLTKSKPWVMLDVYLVGLAVAAYKVREYATLEFDIHIIAFIFTALLTTLLFIKIDPQRWWADFYPEYHSLPHDHNGRVSLCPECEYSFDETIVDKKGHQRCPRCESNLDISDNIKLQRVWATLIAGAIMMIPANIFPISSVELAGVESADTLMSGVMTFLSMGSYAVAAIVFIASIAVPFSKIAVIFYLLLAIHYRWKHPIHWQMKLLHYVHFVGRWSMLDLFVLALMMSLVERGQIISFSVGEAAFYFGAAVFLTMISSSYLDARMLWRIHRENQSHTSG
ncbi:paraquat-inducible protein A [Bibersteinia trehalosi]|uniref:Membrane protein n=2 Tax=Bibersteinia trehalosi TaxID=47735 RepID=A0A179CXN1_BIBTR|nr:paraquat-inducible protein A [Bibersteinia trehalosi]OAQ14327.1 membrane protein [Bibersteinia trehalosi Y31]RRN01588.1 paraquat-inducible protein A [Bibersteinia trehalosi]